MHHAIQGFATEMGTKGFATRQETQEKVAKNHFRKIDQGLFLSSLGMGSYLGDPTPEADQQMEEAALRSIQSGAINVIDTAINYRYQCSERSLGKALRQLVEAGTLQRDEVFICSKNGYLSPDAHAQQSFQAYFQQEYIHPGIVSPQDIVGGSHCMTPSFLNHELNQSLKNLGLETLDLMYLHNAAESQLGEIGYSQFMNRLQTAFEFYEQARQENRIRYYGLATWNCFRAQPNQTADYLSLEAVVQIAESVGGKETHGFRFIQLPYNLAMPEALTLNNQQVNNSPMSLLKAAEVLGIHVFTSVPLMQGQLLQSNLPQFPGLKTPAQSCIQFARSTPGVLAPLVGHKESANVEDNLQVAQASPLTAQEFESMFMGAHP